MSDLPVLPESEELTETAADMIASEPLFAPGGTTEMIVPGEALTDLVTRTPAPVEEDENPVAIDHIASVAHCYPGEEFSFKTRIIVHEAVEGYTLEVSLPDGVVVLETIEPVEADVPSIIVGEDERSLRWEVYGPFVEGEAIIHEIRVRVERVGKYELDAIAPYRGAPVLSVAKATAFDASGMGVGDEVRETMLVEVRGKSDYLRYLPALYERDVVMNRMLMLFESFWKPIEGQVASLSDYFDPYLAPLPMVRWLAAALDLEVLEEWPEMTQRRMLATAVSLYRKRGTRYGLQKLLEIYTGGTVVISEHRADNFRLGKGARLGQGIALGEANQPFSFAVRITVPPPDGEGISPDEVERQRAARNRRIRALIDAERPAHVTYALEIVESADLTPTLS